MEFWPVIVEFQDSDTEEKYTESITLPYAEAMDIYAQMLTYDGGQIETDTTLYCLLTAIKYVAKIYGFEKTPNFNVLPPADMSMVYDHIKQRKMN